MNKQKEDIQILVNVFDLIPQDISIESITSIEVNKNECTSSRSLKALKRMPITKIDQYNQLKAQIDTQIEKSAQKEEMQKEFNYLLNTLRPIYNEGDQFHGVDGVEKLTIEGENVTQIDCEYKPTPGIVTLVDFWATWCGPCQKPMAHNQHLLETHPEWKDKVSIVGVSMDDELQDLKKRILDKKWTSVEHYRIKNGWDDNNFALKSLAIRGIPFVILLNKENQIIHRGHPSKVKLEEKISELIAEEVKANDKQQAPKQEEKQELQQNVVLLQKDQFKILKQTAKAQLLEALKNLNDEKIQINVTAIKRNKIERDGSKIALEKSPLKLSYEINVEEKEKLDAFIKANWETLPEAHRVLGKIKVNDPENLKTQIKLKIQETAAQVGINVQYNTEITTNFDFDNEKQSFDKRENKQFVAQVGTISVDNFKKFEEAIKGFMETLEDEEEGMECAESIIQDIKKGFQIGVGQKFEPITDYHKLDGEIETITHKEGQILIIDYWANWCGPCVAAMPKNVKILNDHKEQWGQNVRLLALSLVLADDCKAFMEEKKEWQNSIEYYFPKEQKQIDCTIYGVQYIPHYIIVDKFGIVRNVGSVKNLADVVNKLLAEQEHKQIEENNKQGLNQEQSQKLHNFLTSDQISQLTKDLGKTGVFEFSIQFQELFVQEGETTKLIKSSKPKLTYFVRQNKLDLLNFFLDKIFSIAAKDSFEIKEEISKTINIPFPGIECILCKKVLGDKVQQYYSPFKNEFLCCECAEFDDKTQKGLKRYKYTDNLIFINAPLVDQSVLVDIDDHKIGKNLKIQPEEEGKQKHDMMCNGKCKKQEEGPRYISVTARPGKLRGGGYTDYCFGCFNILKNKESDQAKAIVAYDAMDGMTSDSLFLRVLFNLGYYEF